MSSLPSIKSFLLADQVFRQDTGKWCVIGVFEKIFSARFPFLHLTLGLFVQVTDAEGSYDVRLELRDGSDRRLSMLSGFRLVVGSRLDTIGFGIQTQALPIPAPGRYFVKLFFNDIPAANDIVLDAEQIPETRT